MKVQYDVYPTHTLFLYRNNSMLRLAPFLKAAKSNNMSFGRFNDNLGLAKYALGSTSF